MTRTDSQLSTRVAAAIRDRALFKTDATVIVALSAGADSTALLDLLTTLPGFQLRLVAAHLNHSLRGSDSDADAAYARSLAEARSLPFECRTVDVKALATSEGLSLEDAGRRARIAFLDEVRERWQADCVALAHHADDQAETLLMRLLRGSGTSGLSGMAWRNRRGYVRPLLEVSRCEIESYLKERGIGWREDSSNRDTAFLRNRIRHELLPLLESYNPAIRRRLATSAAILAGEQDLLEQLTLQSYYEQAEVLESAVCFHVSRLHELSPALTARLIRQAVATLAGSLRHISSRHIADCLHLLGDGEPNRRINLPGGLVARREYGRLLIERSGSGSADWRELTITAPGCYRLDSGDTLEVSCQTAPADPASDGTATAWIDLGQAPFPWLVRPFAPGDRLQPLGMTGTRKVKELFIDAKIPPDVRQRTPLIFCGTELLWVAGLRRSSLALLNGDSRQIVRVIYRIAGSGAAGAATSPYKQINRDLTLEDMS